MRLIQCTALRSASVTALVLGLSGCTNTPVHSGPEASAAVTRDGCLYGLAEATAKVCGCHPVVRNLDRGLMATGLADSVRTKTISCANAAVLADIQNKGVWKAQLAACLSTDNTLDEAIKADLIKLADKYGDAASKKEVSGWETCKENSIGNSSPIPDIKPGAHRGEQPADQMEAGKFSLRNPLTAGNCSMTGSATFGEDGYVQIEADWSTSKPSALQGDSFWVYLAIDDRMIAGNVSTPPSRDTNNHHWRSALRYRGEPPKLKILRWIGDC